MSRSRTPVNAARGHGPGELIDLLLLTGCFAASGLAALVYQTAWARQFALVYGTSELAVAAVLAAYMGGLALGAAVAARWLPRIAHPVRTYALLELAIGASALIVVPALLGAAGELLIALYGGQPEPPSSHSGGIALFHLLTALVALALPTTLMGATLPLLARHAVTAESQIGRRVGLLYAANTAGAVAGALLAAFWLLPALGLRATVWAGAAVNLLVGVLAVLVARRAAPVARGAAGPGLAGTAPHATPVGYATGATWILPLMLASGAVSFLHEVLWTRMLSHLVGSSIHAFGLMLASFLAGIALGGAAGAWLAHDRSRSVGAFALCQLAIALAAIVAWHLLDGRAPTNAGLAANALFSVLLLLPMTFFIGCTFPLAVRILAARSDDAAPASGRVYAWNTVGAIIGAVAGGYYAIPALGFHGAVRLAALTSLALAAASVWLLRPAQARPSPPRPAWRPFGGAITATAALGALLFNPGVPVRLYAASPLGMPTHGRLVHHDVGRSASVAVLEQDGRFALRTNGLPEALIEPRGAPPRYSGESWLSPLAVLARPDTRSLLVVGLGGGAVVDAVPPSVEEIDVIEIEPAVIDANKALRPLRERDPLADPRVELIVNDARGALRLTTRRYDAIVSQPSHPWTAAASHLYTREFMTLAREHLADDGIYVQWMNLAFLDEALLRSLARTILDVYAEVRIYRPDPGTLVFLGSARPIEPERLLMHADAGTRAATSALAAAPAHYARYGLDVPEDLFAALVADTGAVRRLARDAPAITDDANRMATASAMEIGRGLTPAAASRLLAADDPLTRPAGDVQRQLAPRMDMGYIARRLAEHASGDATIPARLERLADSMDAADLVDDNGARAAGSPNPRTQPDSEYVRAIALLARGERAQARAHLRAALERHPDDAALRYEVLRPHLGALSAGVAPSDIVALAAGLPDAPATVLAAARAATRSAWNELAALDGTLASAAWTDPWASAALQLRIEWRTRLARGAKSVALADEALALVDHALVTRPSIALLSLRTRAAFFAGRRDAFVASVLAYSHAVIDAAPTLDAAERLRARRTLEVYRQWLRAARDPGQSL